MPHKWTVVCPDDKDGPDACEKCGLRRRYEQRQASRSPWPTQDELYSFDGGATWTPIAKLGRRVPACGARPEWILAEWLMATLGGPDFCAAIREDSRSALPGLLIAVVYGATPDEVRERAARLTGTNGGRHD